MPIIGKNNKLKVVKELDFGMYLDGAELGEILIPRRYIPEDCKVGDTIDVFLYFDSEDRIIATTEKPFVMVGEFELLRVTETNQVGAFMNWGLLKELLVPFKEQKVKMEKGRSYIVYVFYDRDSNRIAGSARLERFLDKIPPDYEVGQEVELLIWQQTDLGFKVIINDFHKGILYANEIFQTLNIGERTKGFIKKVRDDGKIDVCLSPFGYAKVEDNLQNILDYLEKNGGYGCVSDKTPPDVIYNLFGISKKTFKSAIGTLYKQGKIAIEKDGIKLIVKK